MSDPGWMDEIDERPFGIRYYDRQGNPITPRQSHQLVIDNGFDYKIVAQEYVGDRWVSTVWLGMDHGFSKEHPLIFETMIFNKDGEGMDCWRYSTEQGALDGHAATVVMLQAAEQKSNDRETS